MLIMKSKNLNKQKMTISDKLKSNNLGPKDWWKTLKSLIKSSQSSNMPPLIKQGEVTSDNKGKAEILNDFFHHKIT